MKALYTDVQQPQFILYETCFADLHFNKGTHNNISVLICP